MLPEIRPYIPRNIQAREPIEQYNKLLSSIAEDFDKKKAILTPIEIALGNIKSTPNDKPIVDAITSGYKNTIESIAKDLDLGNLDKVTPTINRLAIDFVTNQQLKHSQEQALAYEKDLALYGSTDYATKMVGSPNKDFRAFNPDGTFNYYKSGIEHRLDWSKEATDLMNKIMPSLETELNTLDPETSAKLGGRKGIVEAIIEKKDAEVINKVMPFVLKHARGNEALQQYAKFNGGETGLADYLFSTGMVGQYNNTQKDIHLATGISPNERTGSKATSSEDAAFEEATRIVAEGNVNSFNVLGKPLPEDSRVYVEQKAPEHNPYVDYGDNTFKISYDKKSKEFIDDLVNSNKDLLRYKDKNGKINYSAFAKDFNKKPEALAQLKNDLFGSGKQFTVEISIPTVEGSYLDKLGNTISGDDTNVFISGKGTSDKDKLSSKLSKEGKDFDFKNEREAQFLGITVGATDDDKAIGFKYSLKNKNGEQVEVVKYDSELNAKLKGATAAKKNAIDIIRKSGEEVLTKPFHGKEQTLKTSEGTLSIQPIFGNLNKSPYSKEIISLLGNLGEGFNLVYRIHHPETNDVASYNEYLTPTEYDNFVKTGIVNNSFIRNSFKKAQ
jgi:hypothetical protein